jgi:hypothetical protein
MEWEVAAFVAAWMAVTAAGRYLQSQLSDSQKKARKYAAYWIAYRLKRPYIC